ncbi:MAG: histone deacetylase [Chloroflexota bacterium]
MRAFYYDHYTFPLKEGHRFPSAKYRLLREKVIKDQILSEAELLVPTTVTRQQLLRVHTPDYVHRFENGLLTKEEIRRIGLDWSPQLVTRIQHVVGATIAVCRVAIRDGIALSLGGGTHHACTDHGQGYCLYNDIMVGIRTMQAEGRIKSAVVIDCDVHQGNGTAEIAAGDSSVYTFSIHGEKNFPFRKIASDWDIGLPDGTEDEAYLGALETAVSQIINAQKPDFVVYLAGADVHENDRLGRLKLTKSGIRQRDEMVLSKCQAAGIPVAVLMAGGYGKNLNVMVDVQAQTVKVVKSFS